MIQIWALVVSQCHCIAISQHHCIIMILCFSDTLIFWYCVTVSLWYYDTLILYHCVIVPQCHYDIVILRHCIMVILRYCITVIQKWYEKAWWNGLCMILLVKPWWNPLYSGVMVVLCLRLCHILGVETYRVPLKPTKGVWTRRNSGRSKRAA